MQKMNKNMYQQLSASVLLSRVKYLWFLYPLSFIQTEKGKMTIIVDFLSYIQKTLPKTQILNTMRWKHHTKRSITIIIGVFTCENMILVKGNLNTLHKNSIYVKDILDAPFMLTLKPPLLPYRLIFWLHIHDPLFFFPPGFKTVIYLMWLLFITDLNDHALIKNMDLLFNTEMDIEVQYLEDSLFILRKCWLIKTW